MLGKSNGKIGKGISNYFFMICEVLAMRTIYNDDRDKNHKGHITVKGIIGYHVIVCKSWIAFI